MIFPRATTLVEASKISGCSRPAGNADGNRIGAEESDLPPKRRHVRRRVRNRDADAPGINRLLDVVGRGAEMIAAPDAREADALRRREIERGFHRPRRYDGTEAVVSIDQDSGARPLRHRDLGPRVHHAGLDPLRVTGKRTIPCESTPRSSALTRHAATSRACAAGTPSCSSTRQPNVRRSPWW